jgi:MFS family permease
MNVGGDTNHSQRALLSRPQSQAIITLIIATLIYTLNVADRFIFSALVQPIKTEFQLSDAGVAGVNLALGLVLMTCGIPAGILADKMSRKILLAASTTIFSAMTALGGMTSILPAFVATRIGVGFGEAGCTPSALSLLSDRFKPSHRSVAMTIYTLGICAGSALGTALAANIAESYGWRAAMLTFGLIGLPLGLLASWVLTEPERGVFDQQAALATLGRPKAASLKGAISHIWNDKALLFIIVGGATISTWGWGLLWWTPTFFVRTYNFSVAEGGGLLGKIHLIGGTSATLLIAFVMHGLSNRSARAQIWTVASITTIAAIASIVAYATSSVNLSILCVWLYAPVLYMYTGPTYGLMNNFSPPEMRAKVVAIFLFLTTLGNLVLAPTTIGFLSDIFANSSPDSSKSLQHAMIIFAPLGIVAGLLYAIAGVASGSRGAGGTKEQIIGGH